MNTCPYPVNFHIHEKKYRIKIKICENYKLCNVTLATFTQFAILARAASYPRGKSWFSRGVAAFWLRNYIPHLQVCTCKCLLSN
jgi:hypothetical protein